MFLDSREILKNIYQKQKNLYGKFYKESEKIKYFVKQDGTPEEENGFDEDNEKNCQKIS